MSIQPHARALSSGACLLALLAVPTFSAAAVSDEASAKSHSVLTVPIAIDGPSVPMALNPAGRGGRLTFQARAGERLGFALSGVKFLPASASALVVTVRQPDGSLVPASTPVHCMVAAPANPKAACDGQFTATKSGRHTIEIDAPFSAAAELVATLSRPAAATLAMGSSHRVPISRPGQDARLRVALKPGAEVSVSASATEGPFGMKVFTPDGSLLRETRGNAATAASLSISGAPGDYIVEIDPSHAGTGIFTVLAKAASAATIGGDPIEIRSASTTDIVRVPFTAKAGEKIVLAMPTLAFSPDVDASSVLAVEASDGRPLTPTAACRTKPQELGPDFPRFVPACKVTLVIPEAGRYVATIKPPSGGIVSGRLYISEIASLPLETGAAVQLGAMRPGQEVQYIVSASGAHELEVRLSDLVTSPPSARVMVGVQGNGRSHVVGTVNGKLVMPLRFQPPGKFSITVDPAIASIESARLVVIESEASPKEGSSK